MKYDRLYNFISPVTGKLPIDRCYTLLGDKDGRSFVSPILIDVRQDIIDLKRKIGNFEELKKLNHNRIWIGDYYNEPIEQLHIGVVNLPVLGAANFPLPLFNLNVPIPNPTFNPFSGFDWLMSGPWLPQVFSGNPNTLNTSSETVISSSLAMTQIRAAKNYKLFDNSNFIVGCSTVTFDWDNPAYSLMSISPQLKAILALYNLGTTYTFTKAQSLGNLETGLLKNTVNNDTGILSTAIAGKDYVEVTAPIANMQLALIRPELIQEGQDVAKLLSRVERLPVANMYLTTGKYWKGGANNIPIEVDFPTYAPTDAKYVLNTPNNNLPNSQALNTIGSGILKIATFANGIISIASGGKVPVVNDYVRPIDLEEEIVAVEASNIAYFTAQMLPYVPGVFPLNVGTQISAAIVAAAAIATSAQSSANAANNSIENLSNRKYYYTDNYDEKNGGNIWYDASHIGNAGDFRPGIRVTSWDSSKVFDNNLFPVSIGVFGYRNPLGDVPVQAGFVWQSYMENNSSNSHYRFPVNFGLYYVGHDKGQIGWNRGETLLMEYKYYDDKFYFKKQVNFDEEVIINADIHLYKDVVFYEKFYVMGAAYFGGKIVLQTPYPTISFLNDTIIEDLININKSTTGTVKINFYKDIYCETKGAIKIPVGNINERPSIPAVGMVRYNIQI